MKLTKIVATIGPVTETEEVIRRLIQTGVNVFRFNFKHGTPEWHIERIRRVRKVAKELDVYIGILLDLQGPEIRLRIANEHIELHEGDLVEMRKNVDDSGDRAVSVSHPQIIETLKEGQAALADDGYFMFTVRKKGGKVFLESHTNGTLKTNKSLNIPDLEADFPLLTDRDQDGLKIAVEEPLDFIALSFVRTPDDIRNFRSILTDHKIEAQIVAKIENKKAMDYHQEIIQESDAVMVARGDLGIETPMERVPLYQKQLIEESKYQRKPVITATQMLQSMIENKLPTRAEVSDVANAVYDLTDAVMLSGETASGKYAAEAVQMMAKTIQFYDSSLRPNVYFSDSFVEPTASEKIIASAYQLYLEHVENDEEIAGFMVFTQSGDSARLLSSLRPHVPIFAFTPYVETARRLSLCYGVVANVFSYEDMEEVSSHEIQRAKEILVKKECVANEASLIVIHGDRWGEGAGATTIRII